MTDDRNFAQEQIAAAAEQVGVEAERALYDRSVLNMSRRFVETPDIIGLLMIAADMDKLFIPRDVLTQTALLLESHRVSMYYDDTGVTISLYRPA